MTNEYNNGDWWGWNGGDCPVHPKSRVQWTRYTGIGSLHVSYQGEGPAHALQWISVDEDAHLTAFRVVKAYREPRAFWVNEYPRHVLLVYGTKEDAERHAGPDLIRCIHVREVLE